MFKTTLRFFAVPVVTLSVLAACSGPHEETKEGALIGGAAGAAAGAIIAHDDLEGAAIGGLAGAALGGLLGHLDEVDR